MNPNLKSCLVLVLTLLPVGTATAQPVLRLSSLSPGTEWTLVVTNGDLQAQGPPVGVRHPNPTGWSGFGAMFDEVDEGTAMFKLAPTVTELPAQGTFVPLIIEGTKLPCDWHLRVAAAATRILRGDSPVTPVRPGNP